jgi:hypothetical protein
MILAKLIVNCPKYGLGEYIINTQVADNVQDEAVNRILKYYSAEAIIDFEKIC